MQHTFVLKSLDEIEEVAEQLLKLCGTKRVIAFYGHMGAGKTTFIKELCKAAGVIDNVSSPTFSLVNEYHTTDGEKVFHFDFYRIKSLHEAYDIGYEDYLYSGNYCFIEWPEKIEELLPDDVIKVNIKAELDGFRTLTVNTL
jgi:tRNA threonylcarbamoyladenosine biosynthesis protein TsaE